MYIKYFYKNIIEKKKRKAIYFNIYYIIQQ